MKNNVLDSFELIFLKFLSIIGAIILYIAVGIVELSLSGELEKK